MSSLNNTLLQEPNEAALTRDLLALYEATRARMGDEDLAHIRHVAAYSRAIKARSQELLQKGGKEGALQRGITLYMLHVLLEFSELGHNIMHGSYDHLPNAGEFHSARWHWDFVTSPREWKVMHHQNHHPFTNIVNKDHDIGYSFLRVKPGQDWYAHHALQPAGIAALMIFHSYYFTLYTATSAARTEGRKVLSLETFQQSLKLIRRHALKNFLQEPLQAGSRFLHTLLGNYAGMTLGYDLTIAILALEHHAPNVQLFQDPGPEETQDQYFRRQLLATSNFTPAPELDAYFQKILLEEIDFPDRPGFEIFYGGLDTHVEHHLFPDLPCQRQREIVPQVRAICAAHGLPYNVIPLGDVVPDILKSLARWAVPAGEAEQEKPTSLLRRPRQLFSRLLHGARYSSPSPTTYLKTPSFFNVPVKVVEATALADGQALRLRLETPEGWNDVHWDAGAFISLRIPLGDKTLVRQYSLTRDSRASGRTLDITVKRVKDGLASNQINDSLRKGKTVTLVGVPQSDGSFIMKDVPRQALFIAAGVGITPILSMLDKLRREAPDSDAILLYFNHDRRSMLFEQELKDLVQGSRISLRLFCSTLEKPDSFLQQGRFSLELLQREAPDLAEREVFVCAPPGFIDAARAHTRALGLDPQRFHTESFTPPTLLRTGTDDQRQHRIRFQRSRKEIQVSGNTTLLEAARQAGIEVPSGCERGLCKACVCTKLGGMTQHDIDHHKQGADIPLKRITVCNSLPRSDIELDL